MKHPRLIQGLVLVVLFILSIALFSTLNSDSAPVEEGMPAGYQPNP